MPRCQIEDAHVVSYLNAYCADTETDGTRVDVSASCCCDNGMEWNVTLPACKEHGGIVDHAEMTGTIQNTPGRPLQGIANFGSRVGQALVRKVVNSTQASSTSAKKLVDREGLQTRLSSTGGITAVATGARSNRSSFSMDGPPAGVSPRVSRLGSMTGLSDAAVAAAVAATNPDTAQDVSAGFFGFSTATERSEPAQRAMVTDGSGMNVILPLPAGALRRISLSLQPVAPVTAMAVTNPDGQEAPTSMLPAATVQVDEAETREDGGLHLAEAGFQAGTASRSFHAVGASAVDPASGVQPERQEAIDDASNYMRGGMLLEAGADSEPSGVFPPGMHGACSPAVHMGIYGDSDDDEAGGGEGGGMLADGPCVLPMMLGAQSSQSGSAEGTSSATNARDSVESAVPR